MAITNGYCTLDNFKASTQITDNNDDTDIEAAIETASRQIDGIAGKRRFWQDGTVVARTYYPSEPSRVWVDDISTLTGLIVKVDQDGDGTFETTLTINTDFIVEPINAAAEWPVRPWESIRLLQTGALSAFSCLASGRPSVQVTAKFGWSAVPDPVERACVNQAKVVFKAIDAQNDTIAISAEGYPVRIPAVSSMMRASLEPFIRYTEVDDRAHD